MGLYLTESLSNTEKNMCSRHEYMEVTFMKKYKWLMLTVFAAILTLIAGCGEKESESADATPSDSSGEETYEWKLAWNSGLDNTPRGEAAKAFAEYVEEKSDGRVTFEFFPDETYGTALEMAEAVKIGALDMQVAGSVEIAEVIPQWDVLSLPFLIQDTEEAYAVLDGDIGNKLRELSEEEGYKVIGMVDLGFAQITNNIRPIRSPKDLEGIKMRSSNNKVLVETFTAFGSSVSTMPYSEIYNGLAQGVVDGQFNPLLNIFDQKINEVQDYLSITNHAYYFGMIVVNAELFNSLDEELQQIVLEGGKKGQEASRKLIAESFEKNLERAKTEFKEVVLEPDLAPFQELAEQTYESMEEVMGPEIIAETQEFLKEYRKNN